MTTKTVLSVLLCTFLSQNKIPAQPAIIGQPSTTQTERSIFPINLPKVIAALEKEGECKVYEDGSKHCQLTYGSVEFRGDIYEFAYIDYNTTPKEKERTSKESEKKEVSLTLFKPTKQGLYIYGIHDGSNFGVCDGIPDRVLRRYISFPEFSELLIHDKKLEKILSQETTPVDEASATLYRAVVGNVGSR